MAATHLECARCATSHDATALRGRCACGGTLLARYDLASAGDAPPPGGGLWSYASLLPVTGEPVSLGEPETPLLPLPRLSSRLGFEVLVKDDGVLPGGTFKARGAAVGVTRARELGATSLVLPSAGNAGGAWALYGARAGLPVTVVMARTAPRMNQDEVTLAGATLELVDGTLADAGRRAREIAEATGAFLAATFGEPYRVEGKKTAWLETFGRVGLPGTIVFPVGGGVGLVAAHKAAYEVLGAGWHAGDVPALVGVQADDCAPIVQAFDAGLDAARTWPGTPTTSAAGLRVTAPGESDLVLRCVRDTGGAMLAVTEESLARTVRDVAALEGVWLSPEGAAAVAALPMLPAPRGPVVVYNTASGPKYA
ncbi:MAG TPA: threonine synthase [Frankiaceae bacterium]|jgi:threonine synthase|nr:threonine synthase [Frankiaceae bacterium]